MSSVHCGNEACGDSGTFSARMQDTRICGTRHPGDPLSVMRAGAANLRETPRRPTIFAWVRKVIRELMAAAGVAPSIRGPGRAESPECVGGGVRHQLDNPLLALADPTRGRVLELVSRLDDVVQVRTARTAGSATDRLPRSDPAAEIVNPNSQRGSIRTSDRSSATCNRHPPVSCEPAVPLD